MKINRMNCASIIVTDKESGRILVVINDDQVFSECGLDVMITQNDEEDISVERKRDGGLYIQKKPDFSSIS